MSADTGEGPRARRVSAKGIIAILIGLVALVFVFQSTGSGEISFLMWDFSAPAWLWLLLVFLAGVLVGSLFPWFRRSRRA